LFEDVWAQYVRVLVVDDEFCGLVTFVHHEKSSWIGNLIVPEHLRGRGYGGCLFAAALQELNRCGSDSTWLTASKLGQPIYEKAGFVAVDRIERWVLPPAKRDSRELKDAQHEGLLRADRDVWSEDRRSLLSSLLENGKVYHHGESVALLQSGADIQIIGPWYGRDQADHRQLLRHVIAAATPANELVIDLLASSSLQKILIKNGFVYKGSNQLMLKGEVHVDISRMVSLASLGSVG
jgi:predicted GNAT family N-acyltransferase